MILSHSKKFIFIHNYKVAGTSITNALKKYDNPSFSDSPICDKIKILFGNCPKIYSDELHNEHITASELKNKIPAAIFNDYYKFGFVRDPWDWQVSFYTYMLKIKDHHQHKLIKSMKNFDEYIDWRVNEDLHLQKDFFYDGENCLVDFIGKMKNLNTDFKKICAQIGIKTNLPRLNASRNTSDNYLKYYSQKSIDIVYEAFKEDIELFGYSKPILASR